MKKEKSLFRYGLALGMSSFLTLIGCGSRDNPAVPVVEPTLTSIQEYIFDPGCALPSCHSSLSQRGGLVLEAGRSYTQLVNVPAENDAAKAVNKLRVVPGQPEKSFLMDKLTGPGPDEGSLMPSGTDGLAASQIEVIRTWIQQGARPE